MGIRLKLRPILGNILVFTISTVVTVIVAELIASYWLTNHATQDQFRKFGTRKQNMERYEERGESASKYFPHRYIGYVPSPNYKRDGNYHNSAGYRGEPFPMVKDENEFRIVCVGGSTTYTSFVTPPSESYPAVLERELRKRGFAHVRVINAGAEGWASWETLANLNFRVLDLDPDMIIIYHAVNDVATRIVWPPRMHKADRSGFVRHSSGLDKPASMLERSSLMRILMVAAGRWSSPLELRNAFGGGMLPSNKFWAFVRQQRTDTYPKGIFTKAPIELMLKENTTDYFKRNIESVVTICKHNGIKPILATFKVNRSIDGSVSVPAHPILADAIDEHNQIIRTIGSQLDVPVFEFAEAFPSDMDLFVDAVHMTPKGAQLKGSMFAEFLHTQNLMDIQ
ncbi:MAG: hypothetical protein VCB26_01915 [Candidatus Hydrogenedentota bacterium]